MIEQFDRISLVVGQDYMEKLQNKKIIIFGVGGVGGYVAELLVRSGVKHLTIVDFDVISTSNLNRQIVALQTNIGKYKVDELKMRLLQINNEADILALKKKLDNNIEEFNLCDYDYVVDAIDDIDAKIDLINYCFINKLNLISSLGTGNRFGVPNFIITDIYKTQGDGLARKLRHELRKLNITKQDVVYCPQESIKLNKLGSVAPYPCSAACTIVGYLLKNIIKEN